ncbi:ArsA family ATPase [Halostella sp. JP-L12]|uniref:ArsA family ATPase n=1 Tax=Halostella TaxID=1843185 RepID=UPI000EF7F57E|nr:MULTISPECIES: ArsA family ATPase [Halostella]NHN47148.1 ArsA family ATPase [Halostella sp. JP-L12]
MTRVVCYGGKGGVGKTTCAAATALVLADRGERALVVSTDPAHSLGDSLGVAVGDEVRELRDVTPGLHAVEVGPERGQAAYRRVVEALADEFRSAGLRMDEEDMEALFGAGVLPGGDEAAALDLLAEYAAEGPGDRAEDGEASGDAPAFDAVVLDTAPTGHTLRLLDLPDVLDASLAAAGKLRGQVSRMVDSARSVVFGPAAFFGGDDGDDIDDVRARFERAGTVLRDPDRTEFRPVLVPEAMAIAETERLVETLREDGVPVGRLVVNRVLRDTGCDCSRCRSLEERHTERLAEIRERFPGREVVELPELEGEAGGPETLRRLGDRLA